MVSQFVVYAGFALQCAILVAGQDSEDAARTLPQSNSGVPAKPGFSLPTFPPLNLSLPTFPPLNLSLPTLPPVSTPCIGKVSLQSGSCHSDCTGFGGVVDGDCLPGFGSCCITPLRCGSTAVLNNTVFANHEYPGFVASGLMCQLIILKMANVVQLRVELTTFQLQQPDEAGFCSSEAMIVTGANPDFVVPRLCGVNDGQHLIIPVDQTANNAQVALRFATSTIGQARWLIKVIQLEHINPNLAPAGCLQYVYGEVNGNFSSFNFDRDAKIGKGNIGDIRYSSCFRRESGFCSLRFESLLPRVRRHVGYVYPMNLRNQAYIHPMSYYVRKPVNYQRKRVYAYPLHVERPASHKIVSAYRPPYQSPFESGWQPNNGSAVYLPPITMSSGSTVAINTADVRPSSTPSTVAVSEETTTIIDLPVATNGSAIPIVDRPANSSGSCSGEDVVSFPPLNIFCATVEPQAVTLKVNPFVVYVDNRGATRGKGFYFSFSHQTC